MSARRPLGEVIVELSESLATEHVPPSLFRVTTLAVDVPIEVALERSGSDIVFVADAPRWRWRSVFDRTPGRMTLHLGEGVPE